MILQKIKELLLSNRTLLVIITLIMTFIAGYFPYPVLAKFIFKVLWDFVFNAWACIGEVPNTAPLRTALTPLLLVGIILFWLLQKLSTMLRINHLRNLATLSSICSWYCVIMTLIVILVMWFDFRIFYNQYGIVVDFGHCLRDVALGEPDALIRELTPSHSR